MPSCPDMIGSRVAGTARLRDPAAMLATALDLLALAGHGLLGRIARVDKRRAHGQPIERPAYAIAMLRDTFESR